MTATELDVLDFHNRFTAALPADPDTTNHRRQVEGAAYSRVSPTAVSSPTTVAVAPEVADLLGIPEELWQTEDFAAVFSGSRVPAGADPHAAVYGGHQFGNWAGQLGDGRAIALGEVRDRHGGHQMLQLKGAGPTPYARTADGRAVLRSSLREYLCSEAMAHLGIPTTRALSLVLTGDQVVRDVLYDGNPAPEPGAVVCRVAPSFLRFGTFQLPASRGDVDLLGRLVGYAVRTEAPEVLDRDDADLSHTDRSDADLSEPVPAEAVGRWFHLVCERTATLVADWMRVGFVHGVLNTDNMSTSGLTIDYGPYGWLETFDPAWTPNTTDAATRRYRYGAQPQVAQWNLLQLANALVMLTEDPEPLQGGLEDFADRYHALFATMMAERLGWGSPMEGDSDIVGQLFEVLTSTEVDQVLFFRDLAAVPIDTGGDLGGSGQDLRGRQVSDDDLLDPLQEAFYAPHELTGDVRQGFVTWLRAWGARVTAGGLDDDDRRRRMNELNPRFVLRNYLAQEAIDAVAAGDPSLLHELHDVLRRPYDEQPGKERFAARRPEWARHRVGCSMLSCSS
ncbi:MAG: YdiU family protein [Acidimicrobiia bacterium]|nr:YdiU family protein [Acidimicrobiia bacterium]